MIAFLRRDLKWGRVEVLTNNEGPKGIPKVKRDLLNVLIFFGRYEIM